MDKKRVIHPLMCIFSIALLVISCIPIVVCAFFDYATGDDLGKSAAVHKVFLAGGGFWDVLKQAVISAHEVYMNHEGTWASNFILALQPGAFGEKMYIITPFLGMFFLLVGFATFYYEILVRILGFSKKLFVAVLSFTMFFSLQFMPYMRGGLFWYTGMAHYDIPFAIALMFVTCCLQFYRTGKKKYVPLLLFSGIYIGGSHYQAMLLAWLLLMYFFVLILYLKKSKKTEIKKKELVFIGLAVFVEFVGFYFCYKSPGNSARAEADFGFSVSRALLTIFLSVVESTKDAITYIINSRILPFYIILLLLIGIAVGEKIEKRHRRLYPFAIVFFYLVYCAMYAPALYYTTYGATEGISGGYYDVNYFVLLLFISISFLLIGEMIGSCIKIDKINVIINIYSLAVIIFCLLFSKHIIGRTTAYVCYEFAKSGKLATFEFQMQERLAILENSEIKEVYLPEMNDQQGPFMHMALTSNPNNFTNWATEIYYDKESVIALPRDEYYEKYGK